MAVFPKCHRFTIGQKLLDEALDLFEYIGLANRAIADKAMRARYLEGFMIKFGVVETLLRLCNEKRIITIKQTARLATLTEKIGRQITGWKNN